MAEKAQDPQKLEKALGYHFKDKSKLRAALTHASVQTDADKKLQDNERLEFLGDRVLGLVIASLLMEKFPSAKEGELARRFNRLVRRKTCAEIGFKIELGQYLILSSGEARSGGREKSTIIANAIEALLGAVFLDGEYGTAQKMIETLWADQLEASGAVELDAKTALQEWVQGQGFDLPLYQKVDQQGPDHKPSFIVEVKVTGLEAERGEGNSIRAAEQQAAQNLLQREHVWSDN